MSEKLIRCRVPMSEGRGSDGSSVAMPLELNWPKKACHPFPDWRRGRRGGLQTFLSRNF